MISPAPHPVFASLWIAWLLAVYVSIGLPHHPLVGLATLGFFFTIEVPAMFLHLSGNARDTLSEIATWVQRTMSHHRRFARGWNAALLAGLILPVSWLLGRTVAHYSEAPLLGILMGGLCIIFLWDHFSAPDIHG